MKKLVVALLAGFTVAAFAQAPAAGQGEVKPAVTVAKKKPAKRVHKTVRKTTHKVVKKTEVNK